MIGSTAEPCSESEPGFNLANIIVAERNSRAAVADANSASAAVQELRTLVEVLQGQVIQQSQQITALQARVAVAFGSGATEV